MGSTGLIHSIVQDLHNVYRQNGIYIPRTSSEQKAAAKKVVSLSDLKLEIFYGVQDM